MNISRRKFISLSSFAVIGTYTFCFEPHWVEFVFRNLSIKNLPGALVGKRLVQLSDLHIDRVDAGYLSRSFEVVKELSPDIVLYTGDFTDHKYNPFGDADKLFKNLPKGSLGTFGILGNHDYGPGWRHPEIAELVTNLVQDQGVTVLRNKMAVVEKLQIVGLDDLWGGRFDPSHVLPEVKNDAASIVLSHNPDTVDEPVWENYKGWILAGHTHGGQCKPRTEHAPHGLSRLHA